MELCEAIKARRSIRIFLEDDVPQDIVLDAIKDGILAPSAHNRQPWKFKILTKEQKNYIAELLFDKTKDIEGHTGPHTAGIMKEVPLILMVFIDNNDEKYRDMDVISIGACIEHIILSLTDKGFGTLWIGNTNIIADEIKSYLNVPFETVSCIGIGYKNQDPKPRPRKNIDDVLI